MKILLVTIVLLIPLLAIMISLDLLLGIPASEVIWKAIDPFRVMEPAEYIIVIIFSLYFIVKPLHAFLKKKKANNPS